MIINEDILISLVIACGILLWFKGMYRAMDILIPNTMLNNILCIIAALVILYILNENFYVLGKSTKDYKTDEME